MVDDITIVIAFLNVGPDSSDTAVQPQQQSSENPED